MDCRFGSSPLVDFEVHPARVSFDLHQDSRHCSIGHTSQASKFISQALILSTDGPLPHPLSAAQMMTQLVLGSLALQLAQGSLALGPDATR